MDFSAPLLGLCAEPIEARVAQLVPTAAAAISAIGTISSERRQSHPRGQIVDERRRRCHSALLCSTSRVDARFPAGLCCPAACSPLSFTCRFLSHRIEPSLLSRRHSTVHPLSRDHIRTTTALDSGTLSPSSPRSWAFQGFERMLKEERRESETVSRHRQYMRGMEHTRLCMPPIPTWHPRCTTSNKWHLLCTVPGPTARLSV